MLSFVSEEINRYCENHSTLPSSIAQELEEFTLKNVEYPQMLTGSLVGSFLQWLVSATRSKRILEIGTYTGYSALCLAERLPTGGEVITLDINEKSVNVGKTYWAKSPHGNKIRSILGPALETLETLKPGFDFVFIDADKPNYANYLKAVLPMLNPSGVIVVDNCLWSGRVLDAHPAEAETKAIQEFNRFVSKNTDLECHLLPLRDGLYLIRKCASRI